jgi:cytochrome c-type biogenesis protein CcmF
MAHLGNFFIFAAAGCTIFSLVFYLLTWRGADQRRNGARLFYKFASGFVLMAISSLLYLILTHDFTVAYVHSYSSTDLPLGYLIATLWGGQQGTFLMWLFFCSVMGLIMMHTARSFESGNMFFLNLFNLSLLLMLMKKSPFELLPVFQAEGAGLNPLLQNFWMQIHPPIMFVGFAAIVFPFCFALTALVERRYNVWAESARKWTLFAWATLGTALVLGGYWAYETLGWGGFWAWDPVENSSFIPWIFLTAQVHALFIKRQRRGLLRFSLFVVCLSFWSVLYGTFLTRSGVLADFSVHSFVDLGINSFLVGGLMIFVALGSFLLFWRWSDINPESAYSTVNSRSYLVTIGVVVLFLGGILTLLGTSAPLLTRFTENPSNVGLEYYFATMTPVAVAVLFLLSVFPSFNWKEGLQRPKLILYGGGVALVTIGVLFFTGFTKQIIYLLLFGAASWALVSNGFVVIDSLVNKKKLSVGYLAHVGLTLALVGAAVSAGFETKQTLSLPQGRTISAMGYNMLFTHMDETAKGFDCHVEFSKDGERFTALLPHEFPKNAQGVMRKPHINNYLAYDLYIAPSAMEGGSEHDPSIIHLNRGGAMWYDKYRFTFDKFEFDDAEAETPKTVATVLNVEYGKKKESVKPMLDLTGESIKATAVKFDNGLSEVEIVGVSPENGSVALKINSNFLPLLLEPKSTTLIIELSKKPLILLFWVGSFIVFLAGALAMIDRRRKAEPVATKEGHLVVGSAKEFAA